MNTTKIHPRPSPRQGFPPAPIESTPLAVQQIDAILRDRLARAPSDAVIAAVGQLKIEIKRHLSSLYGPALEAAASAALVALREERV